MRQVSRVAPILIAALAALVPAVGCEKPSSGQAAALPPAPAEDASWAVPMVERRIRAIVSKDYDEFLKTDLAYKKEHERIQTSGAKGDAERQLAVKMQEHWDVLMKPQSAAPSPQQSEYFFAFDGVKYSVEATTEPMPETAETGGPEKRKVVVACTFASPAKAPSRGFSKPVRSAKVAYVVSPHGVDERSYGVQLVSGSEQYFE